MSVTIEQALELYKQGTAVIGNDGKVSFRKEKAIGVANLQPNEKIK